MKELVSAITQAAANRLRSPFLGSFILAWLAINHVFVIEFIFSDSATKITLVKNSGFAWTTDVICPLAAALLYTFALPFVQHYIDVAKHKFIDEKRTSANHDRLESKFKSLSKASEQQARASVDYWREKLNRDLDRWGEERTKLQEQLASHEASVNNNNKTISTQKSTIAQLEQELTSARASLEDSKDLMDKLTNEKDRAESDALEESQLRQADKDVLASIYSYCEHLSNEGQQALSKELEKLNTSTENEAIITMVFNRLTHEILSAIKHQISSKAQSPLTSPVSPAADNLAASIARVFANHSTTHALESSSSNGSASKEGHHGLKASTKQKKSANILEGEKVETVSGKVSKALGSLNVSPVPDTVSKALDSLNVSPVPDTVSQAIDSLNVTSMPHTVSKALDSVQLENDD
ncbi:hypothetical protein [Aliagarivorans marinus]|uniref:hypothetical protein n=1 Tax=Aliagarivorans marinus TaxID=561965 RepID=UPI0003FC6F49|nr:hypothetical protein [Aliagarivorans marinus]